MTSNNYSGTFIVIEGIDGSGKATQLKKLKEYFEAKDTKVATFDFPQYEKPSSYFVREYLNGRFGSFQEIGPHQASLFFALDRFDAKKDILSSLAKGQIVISNRYVASNMAHQGSNLRDAAERKKYYNWVNDLEFNILGIPKPDLNLILHITPDISQKLIDTKTTRKYIQNGAKRDMLESDFTHLANTEKIYQELCGLFPGWFKNIECMRAGNIIPPSEIHQEILSLVDKVIK
ncbi:MAG: thymidylate kinase [Patescibacteria group bacterium]